MGKDLDMIKRWTLWAVILSLAAAFMLRCNDNGTTKHYKFIGAAEWSPSVGNLLVITKDEYDQTESSGAGCGGDVVITEPRASQFQLFLADTSGAVRRQITNVPPMPADTKIKFSPRGDKILFWESNVVLHIADTSGGLSASDSIGYTADADWSPDGARIVVSGTIPTSAVPRLSIINADGTGFRLLNRSLKTGSVAWSSQNVIAFVYQVSPVAYLATINPDGSNLRTLDSAVVLYNTRWSPDGRMLLYVQADSVSSTVYTLTIATGHKDPVIQFQDNTAILSVRYSPDGTMISYYTSLTSNEFDLYVINTDGSNGRAVSTMSTDGSWSPDSRSLAYVYYNAVYTKAVR
jgi:Tol biopolymer transport system component